MRAWAYTGVLVVPVTTTLALGWAGAWVFLPFAVAFGLVPLLELGMRPRTGNLDAEQEAAALRNPAFNALAYAMVPIQYALLAAFVWRMGNGAALQSWERAGMVLSMGLCCGVLGINVAHELGHRVGRHERWMARALLWTSLYGHFIVEHNRGHHRRVATREDPASAWRGQWLFAFILRSVTLGWRSAWQLETEYLRSRDLPLWRHEVAWTTVAQAALLAVGGLMGGAQAVLGMVAAAFIGILLLETVNYVEHYGLSRRPGERGRAERVMPHHSWNSSHPLGRTLLFDLTRHSDHHAHAARPYQVLRHHAEAPQLPTGYPGMMLLAWCPPLFFHVMHRALDGLPPKAPAHAPLLAE